MYELHDFARSSSAHRVRIALNLKGIEYEPVPVALQEGGQHEPDFRSVNPQGMVPVYSDENILLSQSLAIIEYLDERYPDPPLLPRDIHERARARQFAYMIASDIHPLIAFRAISFLRDGFKIDTSGRREWFNYWLIEGLDALELWLSADGGARRYCVGDQVTIADVCLVPQLEVARRNHIDLDDFPRLTSVEATCIALDAFRKAQPATQAKSS
ncbi:MAG: maleylacetoacetate isomerase [Gammaproteobacteria bacterium]|nr:maleylacetoacetate isomerase [Gammaproteobacteria bacterium]